LMGTNAVQGSTAAKRGIAVISVEDIRWRRRDIKVINLVSRYSEALVVKQPSILHQNGWFGILNKLEWHFLEHQLIVIASELF